MMNEMQQEAGDNSKQMQLKNCPINIVNGIDEKRAREICDEKITALRQELTLEAYHKAIERVQNFDNYLISRMQKIEDSFQAFAEPAFHFLLQEAQKTAAQTDNPANYELLSELLLKRINNGDNHLNENAAIKKAVQIVNEISDDSLMALSMSLAIVYYPTSGNIRQGLKVLNDLFRKFLYRPLPSPTNNEWLDNLETAGAIRILSLGNLNKLEKIYSERMSGYCVAGIKKQSGTYEKAVAMIEKIQLPHNLLLCTNELDENYVRLPLSSEQEIEQLCFTANIPIGNPPILGTLKRYLTEEQKKVLHKIFLMYDKDSKLLDSVKENFNKEIRSRENLRTVQDWWNNIPIAFELTSVGRTLAYANLKRLEPTLPDWK